MSGATNGDASTAGGHSVEDWDDPAEREYARRQAALADHYGVDIDSRTVETGAGRVHYLVAGDPDGEPVLALHGVSMHAATWLPLAPALTDSVRLYMPDRPGRGLSAAPSYRGRDLRQFMVGYLVDLLDGLDIDRPHVVGSSLGGQQAFLLAIDHDRVDRLCLLGAPGGVSRSFPLVMRLLTMRGINRLLFWLESRGDPVESARESAERLLVEDTAAIPEAFYEVLAAGSRLPGRQRSLRSLNTEQGSFGRMHPLFDIREEIADIERPTRFVWGSADPLWPPDVGRAVAGRMADAEVVELAGHGHAPWLEPGEEADRAVRSFLVG